MVITSMDYTSEGDICMTTEDYEKKQMPRKSIVYLPPNGLLEEYVENTNVYMVLSQKDIESVVLFKQPNVCIPQGVKKFHTVEVMYDNCLRYVTLNYKILYSKLC
jgi:hypothetical protein